MLLYGIPVFYVAAIVSRKPKSTFKISCAQNRVFHLKMDTEKASWKSPRSLIFQWQRGWDSNPRWLITTLDFESSTFDHSDTSPCRCAT